MKPYKQDPFTNTLKQVILPGDPIVVVTAGRGSRVNTYRGTYLGCRPYKLYGRDTVQTVVELDTIKRFWVRKDGTEGHYQLGAKSVTRPAKRKVSLTANRIFALA